jgi:hypothetical protein
MPHNGNSINHWQIQLFAVSARHLNAATPGDDDDDDDYDDRRGKRRRMKRHARIGTSTVSRKI